MQAQFDYPFIGACLIQIELSLTFEKSINKSLNIVYSK